MIYSFKRRRLAQIAGCLGVAAFAAVFLFMGLVVARDTPVAPWVLIGLALAFSALLIPLARETLTPGPILTIGPEGMLYQSLSPAPIPWLEITSVRILRTVSRPGDLFKFGDVLAFSVRDIASITHRGGFAGSMMAAQSAMNGGGYKLAMVQATADEIAAAIKTYWTGAIDIVTQERYDPAGTDTTS